MEEFLHAFIDKGVESLRGEDQALYDLLNKEYERQSNTLSLVASSSVAHPSVLVCEGTALVNVTAEGYPGRRFHAGCGLIDEIEQLAIDRAKAVFGAQYANVQPHCASSANEIVMFAVLRPGDTILGMDLQAGGHLTHGDSASISGRYFNAVGYGLDEESLIDYDEVRRLARQHRPKLIICGTTAYSRAIDFRRFREIADEVNAFLLADITHIAGLVAAGLHTNPVNHAHFTTTCTHKQLYGPRGGLILMGTDCENRAPDGKKMLSELIQSAVFPLVQGAPIPNVIAAKARALGRVLAPDFKELAARIVADARALASSLDERGYRVISGGTDTHIVLVDTSTAGLTGLVAERTLEASGIVVNKNKIPGERKGAVVTSGIRLGTNNVAARRMGPDEMRQCAELVDRVLGSTRALNDREYHLNEEVRGAVASEVRTLCGRFPLPGYAV